MTDLHILPASNRMAYVGASEGIPPDVQTRIDRATRLSNISTDASDELPRLGILFSSSVLDSMRTPSANASSLTPSPGKTLNNFFQQIGELGQTLNEAKLANCQFSAYDAQDGTITPIQLSNPAALSDSDSKNSGPPDTSQPYSPALQAQERMTHIHSQLADNNQLHHPDLLVSNNAEDVKAALHQGTPAIYVSPETLSHSTDPSVLRTVPHDAAAKGESAEDKSLLGQKEQTEKSLQHKPETADPTEDPLLVALDFDCTLAGAEGDWFYNDLVSHLPDADRKTTYTRFEGSRQDHLLGAGPALTFTQALVGMKKLLHLLPTPQSHRLAFALVTARGHATGGRVHKNLSTYLPDYRTILGLRDMPENSDEAKSASPKAPGIFYMNGANKLPRLAALSADLYLDDSVKHAKTARTSIPTGEILWGPGHGGQRIFEPHSALTNQQTSTQKAPPYVMIPQPPTTEATTQAPTQSPSA